MATHSGQHEDSIRETARAFAPDHYISAVMAPADVRDDLITLSAFWAETGRIACTVSEPMLGEIRLQWWSDALTPDAGVAGHPVADQLRAVIVRHQLDATALKALLEARGQELNRLPFADEAAFDRYALDTDGTLVRTIARILGVILPEAAIVATARAYGRVRVLRDLPYFAAHARLPLWPDALGAEMPDGDERRVREGAAGRHAVGVLATGAKSALADLRNVALERRSIDAVLPVALVEPYLRALETSGHDPMRDVAQISPMRRFLMLWWTHLRGRI